MTEDFYAQLAPIYHLKVDWENRTRLEEELFRYLLDTYKPLRVLDVGCGDGGHARWFIKRKVEYVGVDLSKEMISRAQAKFARSDNARFRVGNMTSLQKIGLKGKFDLILNLGNSLPHLLLNDELESFMRGSSELLAKNGALVVQSVNPNQLKEKDLFFPTPRLQRGHLFSPIYIKRGKLWEFCMQIYKLRADKIVEKQLLRTTLRLWSDTQLRSAARTFGLKQVAIFGSSNLDDWERRKSNNIVMILVKESDA